MVLPNNVTTQFKDFNTYLQLLSLDHSDFVITMFMSLIFIQVNLLHVNINSLHCVMVILNHSYVRKMHFQSHNIDILECHLF